IYGNSGKLSVRVGTPGLVVEGQAGVIPKMPGLTAQHRIEGLILVQDEEDMFDLLRTLIAANGHDLRALRTRLHREIVVEYVRIVNRRMNQINLLERSEN